MPRPTSNTMRTTIAATVDRPMECFVYVLGGFGNDTYRTYVGWTIDIDRRLAEHNAGTGARST